MVGDACIGEVIEGVGEDLFIFNILSKWLRSDETGFWVPVLVCELNNGRIRRTIDDPSVFSSIECSIATMPNFNRHLVLIRRCASTAS